MSLLPILVALASVTGTLSFLDPLGIVDNLFHLTTKSSHSSLHNSNVYGCPAHQTLTNTRIVYGNKCYEFIHTHTNDWHHAQRDCSSKGGHLVTIETDQEEAYIMQELQKLHFHGKGVWIGLNDINSEGHFQWDSGKPVSFLHWEPGQPDDRDYSSHQDCVMLYFPKSSDHHTYQDGTPGWHDQRCSDSFLTTEDHAWICEYTSSIPTTTVVTEKTTTMATLTSTSTTAECKDTYTSTCDTDSSHLQYLCSDTNLQNFCQKTCGLCVSVTHKPTGTCGNFHCEFDCGLNGFKVGADGCPTCQCN